jgi:hypothetical protein
MAVHFSRAWDLIERKQTDMENIEAVVARAARRKSAVTGSLSANELVCYGCVEAAYQVYLAATDEDVNNALLQMYMN